MRYITVFAGLAVFLAFVCAQNPSLGQYEYKSRGNIPYGRGGYSDVTKPSFSPLKSPSGGHGHHGHGHGHGHHHNHSYGYPYYGGYYGGGYYGTTWSGTGLTLGFGYPSLGFSYSAYPYGYPSRYSGLAPYGAYYRPSDQYLEYYLPPTEPAELHYGPQAVKQFLGLPRNFANEPQRNSVLDAIAAPLTTTQSPLRITSAEKKFDPPSVQAMERADHFIQSGDGLFQQQRYQEALGRYKDAVAAAPTYADAHLRKGLAYLATNRPDEAVAAIKLAVQQNPDVTDAALSLDGLLGNNPAAKSSLLETNARRAVADPQNADLLFVVGVLVYFDGEKEEAARLFNAAQRAIGGGNAPHIQAFSKHLENPSPSPDGLDL